MNKQLPFTLHIPDQAFKEKHYHVGTSPDFCKNPITFLGGTLFYNNEIEIYLQTLESNKFSIVSYTINSNLESLDLKGSIEISDHSLSLFNFQAGELHLNKYGTPNDLIITDDQAMLAYVNKGTIQARFTKPYTQFSFKIIKDELLETVDSSFVSKSPFKKHLLFLSKNKVELEAISPRISTTSMQDTIIERLNKDHVSPLGIA